MARILLADDDRLYRQFLEEALIRKGHQVTAVDDGDECLRRLESTDCYDLVVTDLCMPRMDGFELVRIMRRRGMHVPFIAMTGGVYGVVEPVAEAIACMGARSVLVKPFSSDELGNAVQVALEQQL